MHTRVVRSLADRVGLLERETELEALDALIADAGEGRGRLTLVEGPAGIGKTRLLEVAAERAAGCATTVLAARGGELEQDFAFGIVRQLFEPELARAGPAVRQQLYEGAAHLGEGVFAAQPTEPSPAVDPTHATLHGLYWLTVNLAERSPLWLSIDDLQWADGPSVRFLIHLARRLEGLPVSVVLATRAGERAAGTELHRSLALEARAPVLRPRPLGEEAVSTLVEEALGPDAGPMLCAACHEATGGNPFLLSELIDELRREATPPSEISPAVIRRHGSERIAASLLMRVGRIDSDAATLVHAAAVLGPEATASHVARLSGIEPAKAHSLAAALVDAAILEPGEPLRFVHPVVRSAIYQDLPEPERSALHATAAALLAADGADPEAIAVHLLATVPAERAGVIRQLIAAAAGARARGAPETASRYLRRALREAPHEEARPGLLHMLGSVAVSCAEPDGVELMREAFDAADEAPLRAAIALELAPALMLAGDDATTVLEAALEHARDPRLATMLEAQLLLMGVTFLPAYRRLASRYEEALARAERLPTDAVRVLLPGLAVHQLHFGSAASVARLAERALEDDSLLRDEFIELPLAYPAAAALIQADRPRTAERAMGVAIDRAKTVGSARAFAMASAVRAVARIRRGDLDGAETDARACLELVSGPGWDIFDSFATAVLVTALVERDELGPAAGALQDFEQRGHARLTTLDPLVRVAGARLRIAAGDPDGALEQLGACERFEREWEMPSLPISWRALGALAHLQAGDREASRRTAAEELPAARRFAASRTIGVALATLGIVEGGESGIELLADAVSTLEGSQDRLEQARAQVALGAALRRAGQRSQAREILSKARDLAHRCRATAVAREAHQELRLSGARPRRIALTGVDALTPRERQIAAMAAEGLTNKAIAQALFVTLRTVEMHLSSAYGKLGISSREELRESLDLDPGSAPGART